jgi:hypothetical protein
MIYFSCPACQTQFQVGENMSGTKIECRCGQRVEVPNVQTGRTILGQPEIPYAVPVRPEKHRGEMILLLGIAGFFIPLLGVAAWIFGKSDLKKIQQGKMDPDGFGMTYWGYHLGHFTTIMYSIGIFFVCFFFIGAILRR